MRLLGEIDPLVGKYFSLSWVRKNVLQMTEDEIIAINKEIEVEGSDEDMVDTQEHLSYIEIEPEDPMEVTDNTQNKTLSEEEKHLVESMTRFYNSMSSDYEEPKEE